MAPSDFSSSAPSASAPSGSVRLLFVCLGNICRSPTAEAVMRHLVKKAGLEATVQVDSAGTGDWHVGEPPDRRSQAVGRRRGIPLGGAARQVSAEDFRRFDYLLAMDRSNRDNLRRMAPDEPLRRKVFLLRDFEPGCPPDSDVPDPYYGGAQGFDLVFDICLRSCEGLLAHVRKEHGIAA